MAEPSPLTNMQTQILKIASQGNSIEEIATLLRMTKPEVRAELEQIVRTTNSKSRLEAMLTAMRNNWI